MMPHTGTTDTPAMPQPIQVTNTDIQLAVLTEKVTQVIGNHEQRITNLENRGKNWPAIVACIAGCVSLVVIIAIRIPWASM